MEQIHGKVRATVSHLPTVCECAFYSLICSLPEDATQMTNQIPVSKLKSSQWLLNVIIQKAILTKRLWSNKFTTSSGHHSLPSKYNQLSLGGQMMISAVAEIHAFIRTASMFTSYKMHTIKLKTSPAPQIEGF